MSKFTSKYFEEKQRKENKNTKILSCIGDEPMEDLELPKNERIAIVGAGLAGLTAAYRLKQHRFATTIFEGSGRIGGRCFSGKFPNGQVYEHGGELIDTYHTDIQELISELGLTLDDVKSTQDPKLEITCEVIDYDSVPPQKVKYTQDEIFADYQRIFPKILEDTNNAYPATYNNSNEFAKQLDRMTLEEYINTITSVLRSDGKGEKTKFAQLLKVAYTGEFGVETCKQSPLNLLFLLGFGEYNILELFGISDERYHIRGGNSKLVKALIKELVKNNFKGQIRLHHKLIKIKRRHNGKYKLYFKTNYCDELKKEFDHIVLAIPFSMLKDVDLTDADFSALKKYAINNMCMGKNAKLNIQFKKRYWKELEYDGSTYSTCDPKCCIKESAYQNTWEVSKQQDGETGILVNYTGGDYTDNFHTSEYIENGHDRNKYLKQITSNFLYKLNPVLPGALDKENFEYEGYFIQNVVSDNWTENEWSKGSFSYWKTGQYCGGEGILNDDGTSCHGIIPFAGVEMEAEPRDESDPCQRNCHFAGEHTSIESQGFLNGAVESGNRAAQEIMDCMNNICPQSNINKHTRSSKYKEIQEKLMRIKQSID
ncbi:amine oxidase [Fadolivirus algeromassiliense]|jgi:monoamine oxidase|uniref:Amine oxidase n=1 Tax=Fadolivirus FV1/VV64 TaxID=3070911 RepID=A0A7D3QUX9_9VIRU|nr:amine oxidase [Fadolivirus algeromassiliense]QKF93486.1 amine oxidase [Fadolivirus FV1/VV64]